MWIVLLALKRPYTFVVMAIMIGLMGVLSIFRMPTDIFPEIDIPVVAAIWNYTGISPDEMETRIVGSYERVLVSTVSGIEHIESQSLNGVSVVKVFLQEGANVDAAISQVVASSQSVVRTMPPGTFPPLIMRYNAANVPIVQVSLGSKVLSEQQLFDLATNGLRPGLATVPGAQSPYPYGGTVRQIMVDIDPEKLHAWNLSAADVSTAINMQNLIAPAGSAKVGSQEYNVRVNTSPSFVAEIGELPIKSVGDRTVFVNDVATVRDGSGPQTNIVRVDGIRGVLQPVLKSGASTLAIVNGIKEKLPGILATLPDTLNAKLLADQSIFVRGAIHSVLMEAGIAAGLTGLMILLFLGSWRSTLVVVTSIPLSILVSIITLSFLGQTLNVMTLGGMALAVGILVDDATVEIENIHRNLHLGKRLTTAILDGAQQIATPAMVATLCICIVFVPVAFISGAARSLFVPMALAVVFAMLASYLLSRTLVPTMVRYLLAKEADMYRGDSGASQRSRGPIWRVHDAFNVKFEILRKYYGYALAWCLENRVKVTICLGIFFLFSVALFTQIGRDFFPSVDSGQIRMHVRAPAGTRIEETERYFSKVNAVVRELIPPDELKTIIDNIGIPNSGINLALSDGSLMSAADGEMLISLQEHHAPTPHYIYLLRNELHKRYPDLTIFFQPPDIVTQVLNFGLAAPIDIQIVGPRGNYTKNIDIAKSITEKISEIPGVVDAHLHQVPMTPELHIDTDRTMLSQLGISQRSVASSILVSLSSSGQAAPNYWLDPKSGVQYPLAVQTPQSKIDSIEAIKNTPISMDSAKSQHPQLLENVAEVHHGMGPTNVTHYNVALSLDVLASVDRTDLGTASSQINALLEEMKPTLPRGTSITIRGQVQSMNTSFTGLSMGLVFAVVLVYLLMTVNFQSWLDPAIILMALPGAVCGIAWMLFVSQTTINVPSLMGSMMCIGVATANSILLVTFANDLRLQGHSAIDSAWIAGITRLRPVVMTALAMIIGMLPMSFGLGEGGEQNAPLGRAVIGGLSLATFATLFWVPIVYTLLRSKAPIVQDESELESYSHTHLEKNTASV